MDTSDTPTTVLWCGEPYQVNWGTQEGPPFVEVFPESPEFREACLRKPTGNHLAISFDPQGQFLADDELKGQRARMTCPPFMYQSL